MSLAEKIMLFRKKAGLSQEQLAEQLSVSRQAVSKWESAQSVPDLEKIVQMSRLFGVTTDYLLKEELEEEPQTELQTEQTQVCRRVGMAEAKEYLSLRKKVAPRNACATGLCILSPICLILLGAWADGGRMSENLAAAIGLCTLFVLVAVAVVLLIRGAFVSKPFEFLETESFLLEHGVESIVQEQKKQFQSRYQLLNVIGTVLCVLAVIPLFIAVGLDASDWIYAVAVSALLAMIAVGCWLFVYAGTNYGALQQLLQEGDYTRTQKAHKRIFSTFSTVYWLLITAAFLLCVTIPIGRRQDIWILFAVGGMLYAAILAVLHLILDKKS